MNKVEISDPIFDDFAKQLITLNGGKGHSISLLSRLISIFYFIFLLTTTKKFFFWTFLLWKNKIRSNSHMRIDLNKFQYQTHWKWSDKKAKGKVQSMSTSRALFSPFSHTVATFPHCIIEWNFLLSCFHFIHFDFSFVFPISYRAQIAKKMRKETSEHTNE